MTFCLTFLFGSLYVMFYVAVILFRIYIRSISKSWVIYYEIPASLRISDLIICFLFNMVVFLQCGVSPACRLIYPGLSAFLSDSVYEGRPNLDSCPFPGVQGMGLDKA